MKDYPRKSEVMFRTQVEVENHKHLSSERLATHSLHFIRRLKMQKMHKELLVNDIIEKQRRIEAKKNAFEQMI
jgi:hypothetical protein